MNWSCIFKIIALAIGGLTPALATAQDFGQNNGPLILGDPGFNRDLEQIKRQILDVEALGDRQRWITQHPATLADAMAVQGSIHPIEPNNSARQIVSSLSLRNSIGLVKAATHPAGPAATNGLSLALADPARQRDIEASLIALIKTQNPADFQLTVRVDPTLTPKIEGYTVTPLGLKMSNRPVFVAFNEGVRALTTFMVSGRDVDKFRPPQNYPPERVALFQPEILDKVEAATAKVLSQAVAFVDPSKTAQCSGYAVAPDVILTAAHCACAKGFDDWKVTNAQRPRFASSKEFAAIIKPTLFGPPDRCETHCPDGNCGQAFYDAPDLAVVQLSQPVVSDFETVPLANAAQFSGAQEIYWVGYGLTSVTNFPEAINRRGAAQLIVSPDCMAGTLPRNPCLPGLEAHFGPYNVPMGPCKADSGGMGFILREDGLPVLAALVSRDGAGTPADPLCGEGGIGTLVFSNEVQAFLKSLVPGIRNADPTLLSLLERASQ